MEFLKQSKLIFRMKKSWNNFRSDRDAQFLNLSKTSRDDFADDVWKEEVINGETFFVLYKRYYFISKINHGLARQFGVLPAEIPFRIKFHRAPSDFALLKVAANNKAKKKSDPSKIINIPYSYSKNVVPIVNPVLNCFYAYSPSLSQKMAKISSYSFELDFLHYECRQSILDTALSEYKINLGQGPLPKYIIFALSTVDRSKGNVAESITYFEQLDMTEFDILYSKKKNIRKKDF